jgi:hypothetical protein
MAQYRKLDAPMLVAKRESNRPSIDPTVIMEARLAQVRQKKAERLARQSAKQPEQLDPKSAPIPVRKVDVPDVVSEIQSHKKRLEDRMKAHELELAERTRLSQKVRVIEESAAESIAKDAEARIQSQKDEFDDETLKISLQLVFKKQIVHRERLYFSLWSSRSQFQSKAFKRAASFSNFRKQSSAFSYWRGRFRAIQHENELRCMERQLRRDKQMEDTAQKIVAQKLLFKAITRWRSRFRASIELKVIEEQHQKRRALIVNNVEIEVVEELHDSPKKRCLKIPKAKIAPVKTDPKIEAMQKRADAQKAKKIEKAQKEADAIQKVEEERIKIEMEQQRKKRIDHREFLQKEKHKREEQKNREIEFKVVLARKAFCEKQSLLFRQRRLGLNHFRSWSKIVFVRNQFEKTAEMCYQRHLLLSALISFHLHARQTQMQREIDATRFYQERIMRIALVTWWHIREETMEKASQLWAISSQLRLRRIWKGIQSERKRRRSKKYNMVALWRNRRILRLCFKAWPTGCQLIRRDDERDHARQDLMSRAMQYLEELNSDSFE